MPKIRSIEGSFNFMSPAKALFISKTRRFNLRSLTALALLLICCVSGIAQTIKFKKPDNPTVAIEEINSASGNGIIVTAPKIYDDAALILMLNAARLRLATLQAFDQAGLTSRIGAITGATLSQQSISGQILGPPIPQSVTQSLGATGSSQTVNTAGNTGSTQTTTAPSGTTTVQSLGTTSGQTATTIAGLPVENVTTTVAPQSATVPAGPQLSAALPSTGFNISSLNALNEMMQLNYEITNLQLLLEGSLTDRYIEGTRDIKPKTTLGFSITIQNPEQFRDAVAILEVEAASPSTAASDEPPAVTAILPREKTYNVANISDKMMSFGGGVVTQVINGGFSYLRGRKNYFIVQDQDTLAMMRESSDANNKTTVFSWQFRPVLGQRVVTAGLKQTFVQLASPIEADEGCFGGLKIKTYWRRLDRKKNVLREVIPETIRVSELSPISRIDQTPIPKRVSYNDLGSGMVVASVKGEFLPGTYVRIGNNYYREGSPGFTWELSRIRFVANAADVARFGAFLVSRDGKETEIVDPSAPVPVGNFVNPCKGKIAPSPKQASGFDVHPDHRRINVDLGKSGRFVLSINDKQKPNDSAGVGINWSSNLDARFGRTLAAAGNLRRLEITVPNDMELGVHEFTVTADRNGDVEEIPLSINVKARVDVAISTTTYDSSNTLITAVFNARPDSPKIDEYIILMGGKVYGLSDAPFTYSKDSADHDVIRLVLPTKTLLSATSIEVKPLFWRKDFSTNYVASLFKAGSTTEKAVQYKKEANGDFTYLLYGNGLDGVAITSADNTNIPSSPLVANSTEDTLRLFRLTASQAQAKQITIRKHSNEAPILVNLPAPIPALIFAGDVTKDSDEMTIEGEELDKMKAVTCSACGGEAIGLRLSSDKKRLTLSNLIKAKVSSSTGSKVLEFEWEFGAKNNLVFKVVSKP
ncbi:MAG TPA: hypothetical protein VIT88_04070 [Pyrinomonadaceae bacterium]